VVGDLVVIEEGDRVPADGLLRTASGLQVNEVVAHRRIGASQ